MTRKTILVAFVVSLGGFLFGFDAGIISGVMSYAAPEFDLSDAQNGWVVSSPSFAAMIAMLIAGRLSDLIGRKKILIGVAFLYALSALASAYAFSYESLYIARMIGGLAFGAALILAPMYIAEISSAENRGMLVSIQQLNIVLGFFAAFLSNYYFNQFNGAPDSILNDDTVWRWMLGVEFFPAILYFILLFFVPRSPRWLYANNMEVEAQQVLESIHGSEQAKVEMETINKSISEKDQERKVGIGELFQPALRYILLVGLSLGILQQATGINAVYFYATSIFKQTGIGTDAAFSSGVLLSFTTVIFTLAAIFLIDRMGRRPLLLIGITGIAISLLLCAYGFSQARYQLDASDIAALEASGVTGLSSLEGAVFESDVVFKNEIKELIGNQEFARNEGNILEAAIDMNSTLVLVGILGFIACFAFSLGPVMWVMLSELFPNLYRGLAIGVIGFVNSFVSWLIQQIFPWELSNLGSATTFLIYGLIAAFGVLLLLRILPETKGRSLEELEEMLVKQKN
jgi:SP family arabinose:H+ symporter-like MFS transporter